MDKYYIDLARFCLNEATRELQSAQEYVISAGDDGKFFNKIQGEIKRVRQTIDSLGEIALQGTRHITRDAPATEQDETTCPLCYEPLDGGSREKQKNGSSRI